MNDIVQKGWEVSEKKQAMNHFMSLKPDILLNLLMPKKTTQNKIL